MVEMLATFFLIGLLGIKRDGFTLSFFFLLLPFHAFIKAIFDFFGGGGVFAGWKEAAVLLLFLKLVSRKGVNVNVFVLFLQFLFLSFVTVYFLLFDNYKDALPTLRDHIFPILFFWVVSSLSFRPEDFFRLVQFLFVALFITGILGFIQYFWLRIPIGFLMGNIDFVDSSGYISYSTVSHRIMGVERMSGILGGPNLFGVFSSIGFLLVLFGIQYGLNCYVTRKQKFIFILLLFFVAVALLLSFSRAGWAMAIMGTIILITYLGYKEQIKYLFLFPLVGVVILTAGILLFPKAGEIILNSITGQEASIADRDNQLFTGLQVVFNEPFGHGVGSTDIRNPSATFFAESALINIGYEIGVLGLFVFFLMHFCIVFLLWRDAKTFIFARFALAVTIPALFVSLLSINTLSMPFVYFWWGALGIGFNKTIRELPNTGVF